MFLSLHLLIFCFVEYWGFEHRTSNIQHRTSNKLGLKVRFIPARGESPGERAAKENGGLKDRFIFNIPVFQYSIIPFFSGFYLISFLIFSLAMGVLMPLSLRVRKGSPAMIHRAHPNAVVCGPWRG